MHINYSILYCKSHTHIFKCYSFRAGKYFKIYKILLFLVLTLLQLYIPFFKKKKKHTCACNHIASYAASFIGVKHNNIQHSVAPLEEDERANASSGKFFRVSKKLYLLFLMYS